MIPPWREEWTKNTGAIAVILTVLLVVVTAVFLYLVSLSRGRDVALLAEPTTLATVAAPGAPAATNPTPAARVLPSPADDTAPTRYRDPLYGYQLDVPGRWRRATVTDEERVALAADYDVVWEDPDTGARLAVSVWEGENVASFILWAQLVGRGMESVDGQLPHNATVAGQPALLLWAPESPTTPMRYGLFFSRGGRYYRVAYGARDGGAAIGAFARALATLSWPGDPATTLVLPLREVPDSRYWPGQRLYGR